MQDLKNVNRRGRSAAVFAVALVLVVILFGALGLLGARFSRQQMHGQPGQVQTGAQQVAPQQAAPQQTAPRTFPTPTPKLVSPLPTPPAASAGAANDRPALPNLGASKGASPIAAHRVQTTPVPADLFALVLVTSTDSITAGGRISTETLARIDPVSGELTRIGSGYANCCNTRAQDIAYDPVGRRFFAVMQRFDELSPRVLTFDAATGAVTASPAITTLANVNYLTYDPGPGDTAGNSGNTGNGRLLALTYDQAAGRERLASLDPATGLTTYIGDQIAPNCCSTTTAMDVAFSAVDQRLYTMLSSSDSFTPTLYTISAITGSAVMTAQLQPFFYSINYMTYDPISATLWAAVFDAQSRAVVPAQVNPATGAVAPLGTGVADCCALLPGDAALDAATGRLTVPLLSFGTMAASGEGVTRLYSFATDTGAVAAQPVIDTYVIHGLHYVADLPQESGKTYLYFPFLSR